MNENDAQEQLLFIRKIMEETRREITGDGGDFMRWGILTVIGIFFTYSNIVFCLWKYTWIVWVVVVAIGWVFSIRNFMRTRKARVTTLPGRIVWRIWGGIWNRSNPSGFYRTLERGIFPDIYSRGLVGCHGRGILRDKPDIRFAVAADFCHWLVVRFNNHVRLPGRSYTAALRNHDDLFPGYSGIQSLP